MSQYGRINRSTGDCGRIRKGRGQLRVVSGTVVTLAIILPDELPVAFLHDGGFEGHPRLRQPVGQQVRLNLAASGRKVRRLGSETDKNVAGDRLTVDFLQPELAPVE